jgi:hypothetical protein
MAIADRIAAVQADITEYQAVLTKVADQQNQLDTAALQHGNDQQALKDLKVKFDADELEIVDLQGQLGAKIGLINTLQSQIAQLQSTVTYPDLEFNAWSMNWDKVVGGSGLGHATNTSADKTSDKYGVFTLTPDAPIAPATSNYFDCYYTKTFAADDSKKNYRLTTSWILPTAADAAASRCLEMEARHILKGGLMFVIAAQLDFADKQLRYWGGPTGKWIASGTPQARLVPGTVYTVILEGHRDDVNAYHDQLTVNGVVTKLGTQYAAADDNWGAAIKCSLQLDGLNTAYSAKHRTKYEVW